MSTFSPLNPKLVARNGHILICLIVARISTKKQDERSLDDQIAFCKAYLAEHYEGEIEFIIIQSQGSGEHLDRDELRELEQRIEGRLLDVVISEELSRICRRKRAYDFCELCEDFDTRLIAVNDRVDTGEDGWEDAAFFATWHHERANRDTANRIRRSLNNRFDNGGVVQFVIYGYRKPPGAKSDTELERDPAAEPIIIEIFHRLEQGATYAEVADWLNEQGIQPGPYSRRKTWNGAMVSRFVHQTILKGVRMRNRKVSKRVNKTGRHKSVKGDPAQFRYRHCPHLAFLDPVYYDYMIDLLDRRNGGCSRTAKGQPDPRQHVPRKRTAFPGQHARCGICGRLMYWHTTKQKSFMLCKGADEYCCWNSLYVPGELCAERIAAAVMEAIGELPDFDAVFGDLVRDQAADVEGERSQRRERFERELREIAQGLEQLTTAIQKGGRLEVLINRFKELQAQQSALQYELQQLDAEPAPDVALPRADELRRLAVLALRDLSTSNQETGRLLRELLPDLQIMPYQVIDGSDILPRAEFTLTLVPLLPAALQSAPEAQVFTRKLVVTLSQTSKFVTHREEAAQLQAQGFKQREIASQLGMFQSSVERALRIHRQMLAQGLSEPFYRLTTLPADTNRLRRHRHARYRFEPLEGYPR